MIFNKLFFIRDVNKQQNLLTIKSIGFVIIKIANQRK